MISRVVVIAAMVAALAVVGAQASGGSCSDCQYGVKCAETLNDCVTVRPAHARTASRLLWL